MVMFIGLGIAALENDRQQIVYLMFHNWLHELLTPLIPETDSTNSPTGVWLKTDSSNPSYMRQILSSLYWRQIPPPLLLETYFYFSLLLGTYWTHPFILGERFYHPFILEGRF